VLAVAFSGGDRRVGAISDDRRVTGNLAIQMNGQAWGGVQSLDGCRPKGTVVATQTSQGGVEKHLAALTNETCVVSIRLTNQTGILQWIKAMLDGAPQRRNLMISQGNPSTGKKLMEVEVQDALLTQVKFPALNAGSTQTPDAELTFMPEQVERTTYSGTSGAPSMPNVPSIKQFNAAGFSFTLPSVPNSHRTNSVDSVVVTQKTTQHSEETFGYATEAAGLETGDLVITLPPQYSTEFGDWFEDFVIDGDNGPNREKTATLTFKDSTASTLFTLEFDGVGVFDTWDVDSAGETHTSLMKRAYAMYVEGVTLILPGAPAGGGTTTTGTTATTTTATTTTATTTTATTTTGTTTTGTTTTTPAEPALAAPAGLTAKLSSSSDAQLSWDPVKGAEGYIVLMSPKSGGDYEELLRTKEPTAAIAKLEGGPPYYFVVRAFAAEEESENSEEAEAAG
jgi:hypothetical protein